MKKYLFAIITSSVFWGCEDVKVERIPEGNYLPLQIGNYWKLEGPAPVNFVEEKEVTGTTAIDGREYFVLTTTYTMGQQQPTSETVYYRINNSGDVFEKKVGMEKELLVFRLAGLVNEVWFYEDSERRKIQYTGLQSVTLNNSTVDCKIFYSDSLTPNLVDDEVSVSLGTEVGFVMITPGEGVTRKLTKAIINGETREF